MQALGADLLIHYGHSCLVPVTTTSIATLYVFVSIVFDVPHLVATVKHNIPAGAHCSTATASAEFTAQCRCEGEHRRHGAVHRLVS